MKAFKNILAFCVFAFALSSCMEDGGPVGSAPARHLQYELKREVDLITGLSNRIVYEKEYDKQGRMLSFREFYPDGKIEKSIGYTYKDNTATEVIESFDISGAKVSSLTNRKLMDGAGKVLEEKVYGNSGSLENTIKYTYDNNGNVSRKVTLDKDNKVSTDVKYVYTYKDGTVSRRDVFNTSSGSLDYYELIKYGNSSFEKTNYNSAGEIEMIYSYTYSPTGFIEFEIVSNKAGQVMAKYQFEYRYF